MRTKIRAGARLQCFVEVPKKPYEFVILPLHFAQMHG
jgi:hypothetical protein